MPKTFVVVDYIEKVTEKKSCKCGEHGSFEGFFSFSFSFFFK